MCKVENTKRGNDEERYDVFDVGRREAPHEQRTTTAAGREKTSLEQAKREGESEATREQLVYS